MIGNKYHSILFAFIFQSTWVKRWYRSLYTCLGKCCKTLIFGWIFYFALLAVYTKTAKKYEALKVSEGA